MTIRLIYIPFFSPLILMSYQIETILYKNKRYEYFSVHYPIHVSMSRNYNIACKIAPVNSRKQEENFQRSEDIN